jgi:hypothetical protein
MVLIRALKEIFARFGAPDILVSDNGTNFASAEFADFAKSWNFEHITSSPRYAQSNGKAENTVRTVERLFRKCRDSGESEFVALLDWRNTPSEGIGTSPSQRFFGRRCKTLIPTASSLLLPRYNTEFDDQAIRARKTKQSEYYNRSSRHLPKVIPNDAVRIKLPGDKVWSPGVCESIAGPRSFNVRVGETIYRRNRRHMWKTNEEPSEFLEDNIDTDASIDEPFISDTKSTVADMAGQKNPEAIVTDVMEKSNESISPTVDHNNPRRSNRVRKQTQFYVSA